MVSDDGYHSYFKSYMGSTTDSKIRLKLFFVCFKKGTFSAFFDPINSIVAYLLNENNPQLLAKFQN